SSFIEHMFEKLFLLFLVVLFMGDWGFEISGHLLNYKYRSSL
ncbi:MAG: hypothetical protein PWQ40_1104, partial [Archaeoglobus sp.]|nr:hypothetical protein [Archaeoglobus sp.]